jgi:hypothetical protein
VAGLIGYPDQPAMLVVEWSTNLHPRWRAQKEPGTILQLIDVRGMESYKGEAAEG